MAKNNSSLRLVKFPLVNQDAYAALQRISGFWSDFALQPHFMTLDEYEDYLGDANLIQYLRVQFAPDLYLFQLDVISDKWVDNDFCDQMLEEMGLCLLQCHPMLRTYNEIGENEALICLRFSHIIGRIVSTQPDL